MDMNNLTNIEKLQNIEKKLFGNLEKTYNDSNVTIEQKNNIIDQINEVSQARINLYQNLDSFNDYYKNNLSATTNNLEEQTVAVEIVENELNQAKRRLKMVEEEKLNKLRLVEINKYYGEKYSEHAGMMKLLIIIFLPILILSILAKNGILPNQIYYALVVLIGLLGIIKIWFLYLSIISRDNMNYQEYDWYFDKSSAPESTGEGEGGDPWTSGTVVCIGSNCCYEGSEYDLTLNKCVPIIATSSSTTTNTATPYTERTTIRETSVEAMNNMNLNNDVFTKYAYKNIKSNSII